MTEVEKIDVVVNGEPRILTIASTVASLLSELEVNTALVAVEVNQSLVPREVHVEHVLRDGDQVEIVTLVGGG